MKNNILGIHFIKKENIFSLITMEEAIFQMEWAFKELYKISSKVPIRNLINFSKTESSLIMPGYANNNPFYIVKVINIYSKQSPSIVGIVNVFDTATGELVAVMDGGTITKIRTGAASGLATKYLSNKNSKTLIIFGTGSQAYQQIEAVLTVRRISFIGIIGSNQSKSYVFSKKIKTIYSVECCPIKTTEIPKNSIICTATTSQLPVFFDDEIPSGCHINAIGSYQPHTREIPSNTIMRSKIIVDHFDSCTREAGDLIIPKKQNGWSFKNIYCEIGALVLGLKPSRENNKEVTLFKSVGNAMQDLAVVNHIMQKL